MTHDERAELINKLSVQLFKARRIRQGAVISHQLLELLINEMKRVQAVETASLEQQRA